MRRRGERSETILSHLDCRDAGLVAILALVWAVIASTKMVSLIHNHSFGLKRSSRRHALHADRGSAVRGDGGVRTGRRLGVVKFIQS